MASRTEKLTRYFDLPRLNVTALDAELSFIEQNSTYDYQIVNKNYLFGIEVEVENIQVAKATGSYWHIVNDGSLRNRGYEYVSKPLKMKRVELALKELDAILPPTRDFSGRTSVHVHMNVRDITFEDLKSILLLYIVFERSIYRWIGHGRDKNIFCLPLYDTGYLNSLDTFLVSPHTAANNWNKYTGLNLAPLSQKGTIEFRHMYGNLNIPLLMSWVNLLGSFKKYATNTTYEDVVRKVLELNTNSEYITFLNEVFGQYGDVLITHNIKEDMEKAVQAIKRYVCGKEIEVKLGYKKEEKKLNTKTLAEFLDQHAFEVGLVPVNIQGTAVINPTTPINNVYTTATQRAWAILNDVAAFENTPPPPTRDE